MSKNTRINSQIWARKSPLEWCFTCETWVKPIDKMGGKICNTCRRMTNPNPEGKSDKNSQ